MGRAVPGGARASFAGLAVPAVALAAVIVAGAGAPAVGARRRGCWGRSRCGGGTRGPAAAGIPYVGLGGIAVVWLRGERAGAGSRTCCFVVFVVWASDIGAYAVGRLVGGPKLAPRISPGKTRSGAVGGLVAAMLVGLAVAAIAGLGPAILPRDGRCWSPGCSGWYRRRAICWRAR